jgi:hypothetical protein
VKDWHWGGVIELQHGAVKLSSWSSGTMGARGGSSAATRSSPAKKKKAAVVFRALGDWRAKERVEWEVRELVLLLNPKRGGEGGVHGRLLRRRGGGR